MTSRRAAWMCVWLALAATRFTAAAADPVPPAPAPTPDVLARLEKLEKLAATQAKADAAATKRPTVNWTGQLQADTFWFSQDAANKAAVGDIENGSAFRRARLGAFGDYGPTEYRIEMDFALSGRPSFLDVFAGVKDVPVLGRVRFGHFFEPFSLERMSPNRFVTFLERSLPDEPFVPARNTGLMASNTYHDQRGTWAYGFFHTDSDVYGDSVGDGFAWAGTGRVTYLPWYDEATGADYLHLGVGHSIRGAQGDVVRFRSRPESRLGSATPNVPFFVDVGALPTDYFQEVGLELLWVRGPVSVQAEYIYVPVQTKTAGTRTFQSWYAYASWFLTGEHRPYRRDNATLDRVVPNRDAVSYGEGKRFATGPGAWEVAVRLSHLDLDDGPIQGGRLTDLTVGLNWYLNPYLRVTANYIRAFQAPAKGADGIADIFGVRVGYDF